MQKTEFIVHKHEAKRAGLHYDLRIKLKSNKWASFVVRRGIPEKMGEKVLAIRTNDHSNEQALMKGDIESGYGAGKLTEFDKGKCVIEKMSEPHIVIFLHGRKFKGRYHLVSTKMIGRSSKYANKKIRQYMIFKAKDQSKL